MGWSSASDTVPSFESSFHRNCDESVTYLKICLLVNWCFEPSQPLGIISGLKENFIKRYIAERTNKAELRPKESRKKTESCRGNLWNEIQLKGP